ncbi:MAG: hypothetical protein IRZ07_30420 [Microbispora sp.]|nr:hypothetical protein [Microbispora sp.]
MTRRIAVLWLVLFGVYASTLGLHAYGRTDYTGDEPHYLLAAQSLVDDGDLDVENQYALRSYASFYPYVLDRQGAPVNGRLHEPHGVGLPLLITPVFALGGARAVELLLAAIAALAGALAYALALRACPDPWALGAALAVGLSPPLLAYVTAVYPELPGAACIVGAALLALRLRERPTRRVAFGCFALVAALPWLAPKLLPAGLVVAGYAFWSLRRTRRPVLSTLAAEVVAFSLALYVGVSERVYGGLTPYAADFKGESATDAHSLGDYADRSYRLVALWIDRDYGLLRWAPVLAFALVGVWLVWRGRRERLGRALPTYAGIERTGALCAAVLGAQLLVAAFAAPTMFGFWFPGRHVLAALPVTVPLVALGLRRAPRVGLALGALTVAASAWLYVDVRAGGGLVLDRPDAPWGPLVAAWPLFGSGALPYALAAAIGAALAALIAREAHHWRRSAGATRAMYSE